MRSEYDLRGGVRGKYYERYVQWDFLRFDLYNELRWLFVAAVRWKVSEEDGTHDPIPMDSAFLHARALYEFFFDEKRFDDDARAKDFAPNWTPNETDSYKKYKKPANKRLFHLVYRRPEHSGGCATDESDHLKNQVLEIATDIARLTEQFANSANPQWRSDISEALKKALDEAEKEAGRRNGGSLSDLLNRPTVVRTP